MSFHIGEVLGKRLDINVPSFPFEDLCSGALRVLQHVRPNWNADEITFKNFTDGHTNRLVGCSIPSAPEDVVLIRIYGKSTELFIDRTMEVANMQLMQRAELGSKVYCGFKNGLCYGFIFGDVLDKDMVRDPVISMLIAGEMARMHNVKADTEYKQHAQTEPCIFPILKKYVTLIPDQLPQRNDINTEVLTRASLDPEIAILEEQLLALDSPVVFSHNDLLLKNIVYDRNQNKVSFIDYEYAGMNYQAFDIGNHFCEFAGLDIYVPELYPDKEFQLRWLRRYLEARQECHCTSEHTTNKVSDYDVELLYVQVNKFSLASHLMWGIWAIIQAKYSELDLDYLHYAYGRIRQYHILRDSLLALKVPTKQNGPILNGTKEMHGT